MSQLIMSQKVWWIIAQWKWSVVKYEILEKFNFWYRKVKNDDRLHLFRVFKHFFLTPPFFTARTVVSHVHRTVKLSDSNSTCSITGKLLMEKHACFLYETRKCSRMYKSLGIPSVLIIAFPYVSSMCKYCELAELCEHTHELYDMQLHMVRNICHLLEFSLFSHSVERLLIRVSLNIYVILSYLCQP